MLKGKQSPSPHKVKKEPRHWSQKVRESIVSSGPEGLLNLVVKGGAENGQFCWIGDIKQDKVNYHSGKLQQDDIVLEIQGQKVSGFTLRDLLDWLKHVSKNSAPVMFKTVKTGLMTKDLRTYLNTRFQKNSIDHDLQQTIRDNLYRRTVPCTTREQRPGEVNGVDYTFLTVDEFLALEKSGNLLESGLFDGNHYGTPKPPKEPMQALPFRRTSSMGAIAPGQHPSSEGKRRRNRSNVEAFNNNNKSSAGGSSHTPSTTDNLPPPLSRKKSLERAQSSPPSNQDQVPSPQTPSNENLGPLPPNWEMAYTEDGTPYFIDHVNETTHWLDPRISRNQKSSPLECKSGELPYGWEKVEDPHYGTYYIDHVNRKTQYENPVALAKKEVEQSGDNEDTDHSKSQPGLWNGGSHGSVPPAYGSHKPFFTRDPDELRGEFLQTTLSKSPRGFGFTIVGGDDSDEEFLQIKSVVPNGPAFADGKLRTGDVLVYVNVQCVLGYTHSDVVTMFQGIPVGELVTLQVCRGYPLPFDPNDPNTEIVTTVAVNLPDPSPSAPSTNHKEAPPNYSRSNESSSALKKSYDDLNEKDNWSGHDSSGRTVDSLGVLPSSTQPELLTIGITKGNMGFGFTIADSAYGQRVKQILDRPRCKNLQEGDILIEINKIKIKDMPHSEVVKVLKDCEKGFESTVLVQRGGMLTPSRGRKENGAKSPRLSEDGDPKARRQLADSFPNSSNPPFYSADEEKNKSDEKENDHASESSTANNEINKSAPDLVSASRNDHDPTPTPRPKTPTHPFDPNDMRAGGQEGRLPLADMQQNHQYPPPNMNNRDYTDYTRVPSRGGPGDAAFSAPMAPPRHGGGDVYSGYGPRRDMMNRSFNHHEHHRGGLDGGGGRTSREDMVHHQRVRSRTPGPEFMRHRDDDYIVNNKAGYQPNDGSGGPSYTKQPVRSKTPTNDKTYYQHSSSISGTPDFIPASQYESRPNAPPPSANNKPYNNQPPSSHQQRPLSNPDIMQMYANRAASGDAYADRLNSSQSYGSALSSNAKAGGNNYMNMDPYSSGPGGYPPLPKLSPGSQGSGGGGGGGANNPNSDLYRGAPAAAQGQQGGFPRRQSTSFEGVEPMPSNLTRIPARGQQPVGGYNSDSPGGSLNRSASPPQAEEWMEMTVFLQRLDTGFGFRIIGGTEEGSQVSVGHIVPGGAAELDGRLRPGDEIIYVDGQCVIGASHHKVVQIMGQSSISGQVTLGVRRRLNPQPSQASRSAADSPQRSGMLPNTGPGISESYPYDVMVTRRESEGFGFVIISSVNRSGSVIGRIIENSPAERCNKLRVGDRILAVNHNNIMQMHHEDIVALIKESGLMVTLTVGPPLGEKDDASSTASNSQRSSQGSMINAMAFPTVSESDLSKRSELSAYNTSAPSGDQRYQQPHNVIIDKQKQLIGRQTRGYSEQGSFELGEEEKYYQVELHRGSRGFGFSIRGGKEFNNMPLYVLRIADSGAADMDSRLRVGDQLIEINGYNTTNMTHAEAIDLIQNGGSSVKMLVKRTGKLPPQLGGNMGAGPIHRSSTSSPMTTSLNNGPISHSSPALPLTQPPAPTRPATNTDFYMQQQQHPYDRQNVRY